MKRKSVPKFSCEPGEIFEYDPDTMKPGEVMHIPNITYEDYVLERETAMRRNELSGIHSGLTGVKSDRGWWECYCCGARNYNRKYCEYCGGGPR